MLNVNIGVLGHVDSGKTSLAKALSKIGSTASFDKNPQSQARGITLDLGFSAFFADVQSDDGFKPHGVEQVQFTLVDCPGHASLIRTIIGGAQIIDLIVLVIDVTKLIQTQTAECIVIGEILGRKLIIALNKCDMIPGNTEEERRANLDKQKKKLRAVFSKTRWPNAPMVEVAAAPAVGTTASNAEGAEPMGLPNLICALTDATKRMIASQVSQQEKEEEAEASQQPYKQRQPLLRLPNQQQQQQQGKGKTSSSSTIDNFLMFVDHCFPIKGQGTVLTGTVIDGGVSPGDEIYLPDFKQTKKVKSIQMFKKPVKLAQRGDRIGLLVTQFDAESMERGIVCGVKAFTSNASTSSADASTSASSTRVTSLTTAIAKVNKVRFHKLAVESNAKYHFTVGNATVMGTMRFFSSTLTTALAAPTPSSSASASATAQPTTTTATTTAATATTVSPLGFDFLRPYDYVDDGLPDTSEVTYQGGATSGGASAGEEGATIMRNPEDPVDPVPQPTTYYAVLQFEQPVTTTIGSTIIASKLDTDIHAHMCRLAVQGTLLTDQITPANFGYPQQLAMQLTQQSRAATMSAASGGTGGPKGEKLAAICAPQGTLGTSGAPLPHWELEAWRMLHVVKRKTKSLQIDRVLDSQSCIAKGLVADGAEGAAADVSKYVGAKLSWVINLPNKAKAGGGGGAKRQHQDPAKDDATSSSPAKKTTEEETTPKAEKKTATPSSATSAVSGQQQQQPNQNQKRIPGIVESTFGKAIKVKTRFQQPVFDEPIPKEKKKAAKAGATTDAPEVKAPVEQKPRMPRGQMVLEYQKFPFATTYRFTQL